MKHLFKVGAALFVAFAMMTAASAAECVPTPPKDIQGHIEMAPPGDVSLALSYFEQNGCDWSGNDQLNGSDGLVLDVEGQSGTGTLTAQVGLGTVIVAIKGYYLDAECNKIDGTEIRQGADTFSYTVAIPENAKWLALSTSTQIPSRDVSVKLHADGKDCVVEVKPPKHKKKKKKRH